MSHNPKLNVYILTLNSKNESITTFRNLFQFKYADKEITDDELFNLYYDDFINKIGKDEFKKYESSKKVLGIFDDVPGNYSVSFDSKKCIIDGILDGGKFGIRRESANIHNKKDKQIISEGSAVLDKYYFCLCTPLNDKFGFLLIQSYTEETIQSVLKKFLRNFFLIDDKTNMITFDSYVPIEFIEKFKKEAKISAFSYSSKIDIGSILRDEKYTISGQSFNLKIELLPTQKTLKPNTEISQDITGALSSVTFMNKILGNFKKKVKITDEKNRNAIYDITKELSTIKPTIYLLDAGIEVDSDTGIVNFEQVKEYCLKLLTQVQKEFKRETNIDET